MDVCVAPPAVGEACPNGTCDPLSAYCSMGKCVAQKASGEACMQASECKPPTTCTNGKCAVPAQQACIYGK